MRLPQVLNDPDHIAACEPRRHEDGSGAEFAWNIHPAQRLLWHAAFKERHNESCSHSRQRCGISFVHNVFKPVRERPGPRYRLGKHGIRPVIRDDEPRDGCAPGEAIAAAREEGFHHPRFVRATDLRIVVEGMTDSGLDRISFANVPGCPER
jgi:hypothetical protein